MPEGRGRTAWLGDGEVKGANIIGTAKTKEKLSGILNVFLRQDRHLGIHISYGYIAVEGMLELRTTDNREAQVVFVQESRDEVKNRQRAWVLECDEFPNTPIVRILSEFVRTWNGDRFSSNSMIPVFPPHSKVVPIELNGHCEHRDAKYQYEVATVAGGGFTISAFSTYAEHLYKYSGTGCLVSTAHKAMGGAGSKTVIKWTDGGLNGIEEISTQMLEGNGRGYSSEFGDPVVSKFQL